MELIQLEVNNIENYMTNLNEIVIKIKQDEERGLVNVEELYQLYGLYRALQACYYAFGNAIERLRSIPIEIWSQCFIGENPNLDLIGITNYLQRVDTFFKKFHGVIQHFPQLYWREVPPTTEMNNYSPSTLDASWAPKAHNNHQDPVEETEVVHLYEASGQELNKDVEDNHNHASFKGEEIKDNKPNDKTVESCTQLNVSLDNHIRHEAIKPQQFENVEPESSCGVVNNTSSYSEKVCSDLKSNLNLFAAAFVSCTSDSTEVGATLEKLSQNTNVIKPIDDDELTNKGKTSEIEIDNTNDNDCNKELLTASSKSNDNDDKVEISSLQNDDIRSDSRTNLISNQNVEELPFPQSVDDEMINKRSSVEAGQVRNVTELIDEMIDRCKLNAPPVLDTANDYVLVQSEEIVDKNENDSNTNCKGHENLMESTEYSTFTTQESMCEQIILDVAGNLNYSTASEANNSNEASREIEHAVNSIIQPDILCQLSNENNNVRLDDDATLPLSVDNEMSNNDTFVEGNVRKPEELIDEILDSCIVTVEPSSAFVICHVENISDEGYDKNKNDLENVNHSLPIDDVSSNIESNEVSEQIEGESNSALELETLSQLEQVECSINVNDALTVVDSNTNPIVNNLEIPAFIYHFPVVLIDTISESELYADSDVISGNETTAIDYPTVPCNEAIEITLSSSSMPLNSGVDIDERLNNSSVSVDVEDYFITYVGSEPSPSDSFMFDSSSDTEPVSDWDLFIEDVITSALENSSSDHPVELGQSIHPFYTSLVNQWKHVMYNNTIDIKYINDHYANDIFGYCRFITNAVDLQEQHLIRIVMAGGEIAGIEMLPQNLD